MVYDMKDLMSLFLAEKLTIVCAVGVSIIKFAVDKRGNCDLFSSSVRCWKLELLEYFS